MLHDFVSKCSIAIGHSWLISSSRWKTIFLEEELFLAEDLGLHAGNMLCGFRMLSSKMRCHMQVRDIMTHRVSSISPDSSLRKAAQMMQSFEIGALPVCRSDDTRPIGLITDRDITVRAVAEGRDPEVARVEDVMTPELVYCYDNEEIENAVKLMESRQIRRLPVMNQKDELVGILTLGDLATRQTDLRISGEALQQVSQPTGSKAVAWNLQSEVNHELPYNPA
jgi:CBS domain-containing protein